MNIRVVSSDGIAFWVDVHPTSANINAHRAWATKRPASELDEHGDYSRVRTATGVCAPMFLYAKPQLRLVK